MRLHVHTGVPERVDMRRRVARGAALAIVAIASATDMGIDASAADVRPFDQVPTAIPLVDYVGPDVPTRPSPQPQSICCDVVTGRKPVRSFRSTPGIFDVPVAPFAQMRLRGDDMAAMQSRHAASLASCWRRANSGAESIVLADVRRVTVVLDIAVTGRVQSVAYKGLPPGTQLELCMTKSIKTRWKFRGSSGGTFGFTMPAPDQAS